MANYVNERVVENNRKSGGKDEETRWKCIRLSCIVAVSFGLLCVLQITLNISLRLAANSGQGRDCPAINNTQEKPRPPIKDLETLCLTRQNELQERFNSLTRERDELRDTVSRLNAENQAPKGGSNSGQGRDCPAINNTQEKPRPPIKDLETSCLFRQNELQERFNFLTRERDELRDTVSRLNAENQAPKGGFRFSPWSCPPGWRIVYSRCYYISTEVKTWWESRQDCRERGAEMVVIDNPDKQSSLYRLSNEPWLVTWIGLARGPGQGWMWVDNVPMTISYWNFGQPDIWGIVGDCVLMDHQLHVFTSWNRVPCGNLQRWMCEMRAYCSAPA